MRSVLLLTLTIAALLAPVANALACGCADPTERRSCCPMQDDPCGCCGSESPQRAADLLGAPCAPDAHAAVVAGFSAEDAAAPAALATDAVGMRLTAPAPAPAPVAATPPRDECRPLYLVDRVLLR